MFKKEVHHYHIVEYEKGAKLPELTGDLKESLKSLALQPAFQYILQRFRVKKAAMEATLREGFKLDEQQLRYCQAGIFWAGEIERDIQLLTKEQSAQRAAHPDELVEFKRIAKSIELIGNEPHKG